MDKTRTVGKNWLANKLDLQFLIIRECTKFQSTRLNLSKVIEYTIQTGRQIDTTLKTIFSHSGGLKTSRFALGLRNFIPPFTMRRFNYENYAMLNVNIVVTLSSEKVLDLCKI